MMSGDTLESALKDDLAQRAAAAESQEAKTGSLLQNTVKTFSEAANAPAGAPESESDTNAPAEESAASPAPAETESAPGSAPVVEITNPGGAPAQPAAQAVPISMTMVIGQLEQKQALLGKTAALEFLNVARTLADRCRGESKVVKKPKGDDPNAQDVEIIPCSPEKAKLLLESASMAMTLASQADTLCDKAIVRNPPPAK